MHLSIFHIFWYIPWIFYLFIEFGIFWSILALFPLYYILTHFVDFARCCALHVFVVLWRCSLNTFSYKFCYISCSFMGFDLFIHLMNFSTFLFVLYISHVLVYLLFLGSFHACFTHFAYFGNFEEFCQKFIPFCYILEGLYISHIFHVYLFLVSCIIEHFDLVLQI